MKEKQAPQNTDKSSVCIYLKSDLRQIPQIGGPPKILLLQRCTLKENSPEARLMINEAAAEAWKSSMDTTDCMWGKDLNECPCFKGAVLHR